MLHHMLASSDESMKLGTGTGWHDRQVTGHVRVLHQNKTRNNTRNKSKHMLLLHLLMQWYVDIPPNNEVLDITTVRLYTLERTRDPTSDKCQVRYFGMWIIKEI